MTNVTGERFVEGVVEGVVVLLGAYGVRLSSSTPGAAELRPTRDDVETRTHPANVCPRRRENAGVDDA